MENGDRMTKQAPIEHILIPKHKKLSEKEKKDLLERYGVTLHELPSMYKSDSALAGMDVEVGDVIKIERESQTAGKTTFYRGVING